MVPKNLVPLDKWSQTNSVPVFPDPTACPPRQTEYSRDHLSRGTKLVGDHLSRGTKFFGPFVHCDRFGWGPFVQRDQSIGDQLWGTKCPGTICVWDQMCHSLQNVSVAQRQSLLVRNYFQFLVQQCFSNLNLRQMSDYKSISFMIIKSNIASIRLFFSTYTLPF
jgi:hypothetical protein